MIALASASPRRQELLKNAGVEFVVKPANIPEIPLSDEHARAFAERMAREKARAVWEALGKPETVITTKGTKFHEGKQDSDFVLGADTVVVVDSQVLGKPQDHDDAARMLRLLSGRKHEVITGVCLIGPGFEDVRSETTAVNFSELSENDIRDYIASGEPMDKAGAYAIQGGASRWVSKIEGDYSNVVGLPVHLVLKMLREHKVL
jgi:septum formation protein